MLDHLYIIAGVFYFTMSYHYSNFSIDLELNLKIFIIFSLLCIILITVYYDILISKEKYKLRLERIQKNRMLIEEKRLNQNDTLSFRKNAKRSKDDIDVTYKKYKNFKKQSYKKKRPSKLKIFNCYDDLNDDNFYGQWIELE